MRTIAVALLLLATLPAQVQWTQGPSRDVLTSGWPVPVALHPPSGRLILVGSTSQAWTGTWEWNGSAWATRTSATNPGPSPASAPSLCTNVGGNSLLLLQSNAIGFGHVQTWTWDGSNWGLQQPAHLPDREDGLLWLDGTRNQVLFLPTFTSVMWRWDGVDWSTLSVATPSVRSSACIAFDSGRDRAVLFGGFSFSGGLADTWEWDGQSWTQLQPAHAPSARGNAGMAYDPIRGRSVLHGGMGYFDNSMFADTWEWDGTDWTLRQAIGPAATSRATLAFDPQRGRVLLTRDGPSDAWEWTGSNWLPVVAVPSALDRGLAGCVAEQRYQAEVVCFGGETAGAVASTNDTWLWSGSDWRRATPPVSPPARRNASLTADGPAGHLILFGGWNSTGTTIHGDTWSWDGSNWLQLGPATSPAARSRHAAAFDRRRGRIVLFGGLAGNTLFGDTWEWDGSNWTPRLPANAPPARRGHAMAWHEGRGHVILFGGSDTGSVYFNDTWEWDGNDWHPIATANAPSPRRSGAMTFDEARDRCVLFGGVGPTTGGQGVADLWEFDGTDWLQRTTTTTPEGRYWQALAYDARHRTVVLAGGFVDGRLWTQALSDTWLLAPVQPATLAPYGTACPGTAGLPRLGVEPGGLPWLGHTLRPNVAPVPASTPLCFHLLGISRTQWGSVPLPLDLTGAGMTGCLLLASPDLVGAAVAISGVARWSIPIPGDPALLGASLYLQALIPDSSVNPFGSITSNGAIATIGAR